MNSFFDDGQERSEMYIAFLEDQAAKAAEKSAASADWQEGPIDAYIEEGGDL